MAYNDTLNWGGPLPGDPIIGGFGATKEDFLGRMPRDTFFSFADRFNDSPNKRAFFNQSFQPIHDRFLGSQARSIRGGSLSPQTFTNYLGNFSFLDEFLKGSPASRGGASSRQLTPGLRYNFFG